MSGPLDGGAAARAVGRVGSAGPSAYQSQDRDAGSGDAWINVFRSRGVWDLTPSLIQQWVSRNTAFYHYLRQIQAAGAGPVRALELGCGPGRHGIAMASLGLQVTAVDLDTRIIEQARSNATRCSVASRIEFHVGDLDAHLDAVLASRTTHRQPIVEVVTHGGLMEHFVSADAIRASLRKQLKIASVVFDVPTGSAKNRALFERDDIFRQDWSTHEWLEVVLAPFDVVAWTVETHDDPSMTDDLVVMLRGQSPSPQ